MTALPFEVTVEERVDASDWDARYEGSDLVWTADANRWVVQEVADLEPGRALDLAAGEGRNAVWLAQRGWDVTAVDFSAVAMDKGRTLAAHQDVTADWVVADVTAWTPEPAAFDLVLLVYLHLPREQRSPVLRSAAAGVAEGGTLLIVGHDRDNLEHGVGGPPVPEILLAAEELIEDLQGTGLTVVKAGQVRRPVETDDGTREAIDTLVRCRR